MKVLIAEDERVSRTLLARTLSDWGYYVVVSEDGSQAWEMLQDDEPAKLALLDWMMPGTDGVELCRKVREVPRLQHMYLILLTARGSKQDIVEGLQSGADDYVTKPFDAEELRARVQVGARIVRLESELGGRVKELEDALSQVKRLQGLVPICAYCKKIRDDRDYWQQLESYLALHSDAQFSHSVCPNCYESIVRPELERIRR